jgi:son of sevenless-like protein
VVLPHKVTPGNVGAYLAKSRFHFMNVDPTEIARQLALIEYELYKHIRAKECLNQAWIKPDKTERSPNISKMIKQTNDVSSFFF